MTTRMSLFPVVEEDPTQVVSSHSQEVSAEAAPLEVAAVEALEASAVAEVSVAVAHPEDGKQDYLK